MIASPHNEKLKLVRKLRERKHREREGLFATEGEDLVEAGLTAGVEPRLVLVAAGSGLFADRGDAAEEVEPDLLAEVSTLGSGTRAIAVWPERWAEAAQPPCVYLHGVGDPGNVGAVVRTAHALLGGTVVLGPACADPYGPKAVRASMGSVFGQPLLRAGVEVTPEPRAALVAHGGEGLDELAAAATVCLGAEREGLPGEVVARCELRVTIPLRPGAAESLNVAAAAAIACERVASAGERLSSPAMREGGSDA
ncbi:MAG TPA: TrmH family RNA methyltransferase [Solirubrobacterales bacterium]|jgi:TrmH family RNA methyltransferase